MYNDFVHGLWKCSRSHLSFRISFNLFILLNKCLFRISFNWFILLNECSSLLVVKYKIFLLVFLIFFPLFVLLSSLFNQEWLSAIFLILHKWTWLRKSYNWKCLITYVVMSRKVFFKISFIFREVTIPLSIQPSTYWRNTVSICRVQASLC